MPNVCSISEALDRNWPGYYYQPRLGAAYPHMKDFLVAAASQFGIAAPVAQALGVMEEEGPNNNWLTLGTTAESHFQSWWTTSNVTGVTYSTGQKYPSTSDLESINSLNAAGGIYWLKDAYTSPPCISGDYTAWEKLATYASLYNGICGDCDTLGCPDNTAYGVSTVLLAYGAAYTSVSSTGYQGAQYCDLPNTSTLVPLGGGCGPSGTVTAPSESATLKLRTSPYGRNANNRQIVICIATDEDYVSGLTVNYKLDKTGDTQTVVTRDITFAAQSTRDSDIVVIACGTPAADDLAASGITAASSFSSWTAGQFINCGKATGTESYTCTYNNAIAATAAGY